jgi:hypothetical protein
MIARNPDDSISYLASENPYVDTEDNIDVESQRVVTVIREVQPDIERALILQTFAGYAKFLAGLDFCLAALTITIGKFEGMTMMICSVCGYYGAHKFNRSYIFIYIIYQYLALIGRMILLYVYYAMLTDFHITITMISIMCQMFIIFFFHRFFKMIPP